MRVKRQKQQQILRVLRVFTDASEITYFLRWHRFFSLFVHGSDNSDYMAFCAGDPDRLHCVDCNARGSIS
jgi:hypothetical protein